MRNYLKEIADDKYRSLLVTSLLRKAEADMRDKQERKQERKMRKLEIENAVLKSKLMK
jgi:hypothetical protein